MKSGPTVRLWLGLLALGAGVLALGLGLVWFRGGGAGRGAGDDAFTQAMNSGRTYYEQGQAARAIEWFQKAVNLSPAHPDARMNLANAFLLADQPEAALREAREALALNRDDAAAHYVSGCALIRLRQFEEALKALQTAKNYDQTVNPVTFQIGRAHQELGQWDAAVTAFQEVIQFEPEHTAAAYLLGQVLLRAGRRDEANETLQRYQQLMAAKPGAAAGDPAAYERCLYTEIRTPFVLEQPAARGITVRFTDATGAMFGGRAARYRGPVGLLDLNHDGWNSLFVLEPGAGFRLLVNSNAVFEPSGEALPATAGNRYTRCLVGDLQNDRFEDVVVLGEQGSHVFRFATNAQVMDSSVFSRLSDLAAKDGALVDLDFTGKLDLLAVAADGRGLKVFRNLGGFYFRDITATSGVPTEVTGVASVRLDDWNDDDMLDLMVVRPGSKPDLLLKARGGPHFATNAPSAWPVASAIATGDVDNDLRLDAVMAGADGIYVLAQGEESGRKIPGTPANVAMLTLLDYDNDGWLDLFAAGENLRAWRNAGRAGFVETTQELGLNRLAGFAVERLSAADLDNDGDVDLLLELGERGLMALRNDGGNANMLLKLRLLGNRSNASGLGIRVELTSGGWRGVRTVQALPVEIGVGARQQIESLTVRWFDLALNSVDVDVDPRNPLPMIELQLPTGSCPYLYVWDGTQYRFVTDLLGAAPLGLPVAEGVMIEADPDEIVWLGDESMFPARDGRHEVRITEELREVLYLDAAQLWVVDHPRGTEVHSTSKLTPGRPFPKHELVTLSGRRELVRAERSDGEDVTERLRDNDQRMVSPVRARIPQLRGLAEPYSVTLDFGRLDPGRPWVLALTGWLRFGGGMANIGASHQPELPFPFPTLEIERADGSWLPMDGSIGAPAGKTKTIVVDLSGAVPLGARRLRVTTAFEIHWDRIALWEKAGEARTRLTRVRAEVAELRWRGFSRFQDLAWDQPLTPDYARVSQRPWWRIMPSGWCTRYGDVRELLDERDDRLAVINGGDELRLDFATDDLGRPDDGMTRDYFLFVSGWDKDADFHVRTGWTVGPLPWHGMDSQAYGREARPKSSDDGWMGRYNTRWVGPLSLKR